MLPRTFQLEVAYGEHIGKGMSVAFKLVAIKHVSLPALPGESTRMKMVVLDGH